MKPETSNIDLEKRARAAAALRRSLARRDARGAALFMVVMVLTLITAIGVFSMRSASLVDLASGFNRQNVQAGLMAEYAARAAATYIGDNESLVESTDRVLGCAPDLQLHNPDAPCTVLKTGLLAEVYGENAPVAFNDGLTGLLSLPGALTTVQAEFVTEIVEPGPANVMASPGNPTGEFKQITLTSIARVFPTDSGSVGVCSPAAAGTVSQQTLRAHVIVPQY